MEERTENNLKQENNSRSRLIKFFNGKAFYVVLCICFVLIGVAAWSGMQMIKNKDRNPNTTSSIGSGMINTTSSKPTASTNKSSSSSVDTSSVISSSRPSDALTEEGESPSENPETSDSEQTAAPIAKFFINPVLGEIIKDFSDTELQYSLTMKDMRLHKGVDIAAPIGTPVIAAGEGSVKNVYEDMLLGWVVEVDHGNGIVVKYCGLQAQPTAKEGDAVNSSTRLGNVGTVPFESVEQSHLHLEFYSDGKAVSPMEFIEN